MRPAPRMKMGPTTSADRATPTHARKAPQPTAPSSAAIGVCARPGRSTSAPFRCHLQDPPSAKQDDARPSRLHSASMHGGGGCVASTERQPCGDQPGQRNPLKGRVVPPHRRDRHPASGRLPSFRRHGSNVRSGRRGAVASRPHPRRGMGNRTGIGPLDRRPQADHTPSPTRERTSANRRQAAMAVNRSGTPSAGLGSGTHCSRGA